MVIRVVVADVIKDHVSNKRAIITLLRQAGQFNNHVQVERSLASVHHYLLWNRPHSSLQNGKGRTSNDNQVSPLALSF